ncbi:MAG: FAD-dependent oxidoreductase, partial [Thermoleophilia bacterium]|nr:FAD-dependent oxidoreductase [Thermoleophilia bacterium]
MEHTRLGYWLAEAGAVEPAPALGERIEADVLVVGGGYSGLWSAWYAKQLEPEARVVLLEAELCGQGPSGRNGGFCNAMWYSLPPLRERWGAEPALAVARAAEAAVERIGGFCAEHEVDAWFRPADYLHVSTAAAHDGLWDEAVATCRELGVPGAVRALSVAEVAAV